MTTNAFSPQEVNLQIQPLPTYIDSDGSFKINTPMLSTYNFDGMIPKKQEPILVTEVKPGYLVQIVSGGDYYPVVSIEKDDLDLENTGFVTINYINSLGNTASEDYLISDTIEAIYEDWNEKILGSQGWGITAGGNAIFTNVGVRGEIEATTLDVGGINGITYDGSTVIIGASVVVNAPITFNGVTPEELDAELAGYIPNGGAASDIVTNQTTITGGNISTGRIKSSGYSGPGTGSAFSTAGMLINLDDGSMSAPKFRVDRQGNAFFSGSVTGSTISGATIIGGNIDGSVLTSNSISGKKVLIGATFPGVSDSRLVFYDDFSSTPTQNRFWQLGMTSNRDLNLSYDQAYTGPTRSFIVAANFEVIGLGNINGNGSGLYGTATSLSIGGSAATAARATDADNLDYSVGNINKRIRGNGSATTGIEIVNLGTMSSGTGNYLVRNPNNILQIGPTYTASTRKIKNNIEPIINYEKIYDLNPVQFYFNPEHHLPESPETAGQQFGFIAEEIAETLPQAAQFYNDEVINYSDRVLLALAIKTIQEQGKKIDDLETRMLQLESQLGG